MRERATAPAWRRAGDCIKWRAMLPRSPAGSSPVRTAPGPHASRTRRHARRRADAGAPLTQCCARDSPRQRRETLARALPGALATRGHAVRGRTIVPAVFVGLVPVLVGRLRRAPLRAARGRPRRTARTVADLAGSACASWPRRHRCHPAKRHGRARYALAWPALASLAAVLCGRGHCRNVGGGLATDLALVGLVARFACRLAGEQPDWWAMLPHSPGGSPWELLAVALAVGLAALRPAHRPAGARRATGSCAGAGAAAARAAAFELWTGQARGGVASGSTSYPRWPAAW
jgi:hypothetical protein